ncbi:DUF3939 domain-containing protein [Paenibacillus selenitireducens]|uniref:DUF3939 domain-containing protein n=1 Tax=Paenibacillus selenitireducens TaxID=1324314 RepID=UPI0009961D1A|nr:DUF3939 domain-containing protein [Paenibacillus selenitireducens]
MWLTKFFHKKNRPNQEPARIQTTLKDIERAVHEFELNLPKQVKRTVLVDKNNRIDATKLAPYLGGIPTEEYYMSTQTYEIFQEQDRLIPHYLDIVQAAVDDYVDDNNKLPLMPGCVEGRVHYDLLMQQYYLKEKPPFPLFITDDEYMLTHHI